jgi:hypothetical protein
MISEWDSTTLSEMSEPSTLAHELRSIQPFVCKLYDIMNIRFVLETHARGMQDL